MRLAYADPPYPGRAYLYANHPDYDGEVDYPDLIADLHEYDGWALSTSAEALPSILDLIRCACAYRILAWVKHTVNVSWEPVIVVPARKPEGIRDWIQVEPDSFQWRPRPDGHVIGAKPLPFSLWLFAWLGARPDDEFVDLFPGSGAVTRAWETFRAQEPLPFVPERRRARRDRAKALAEHPTLPSS